MTTFYSVLSWLAIFFYWLIIAGITIRVLMKRRPVTSAMTWLLIIYIFPLVGIVAYLSFGELHLGKRRVEQARQMRSSVAKWLAELRNSPQIFADRNSEVATPLFQLCERRQKIKGVSGNKMQLMTSYDNSLKAIVHDIENAKYNIEMVFYIWQSGGLVDQVTDALMCAAKRGVKCRIMVDSAGSWQFFRSPYPDIMRKAGIEFVESLKVNIFRLFLRRMDLRQHRKIILIDNHISYTGSMNMVDPRFFKQDAGVGQWVDIMVRMEGPVTTTLGIIYAFDWEMETGQRHLPPPPERVTMPFEQTSGHIAQVIASGPGFPDELIQQSLMTAIFAARKQLILTTPYFVPSDDLMHAICTAAMRGVDVSIIVPSQNNSFLVRWASRAFFTELLEAGVQIYQFEDGLLHTKSVLVDGQLSMVGSVNLDMRSLWLNFEITVVIDDEHFGNDLTLVQQNYIMRSTLLENNKWEKRPVWHRILERICYFFSPLL
ncbi:MULTISPECIES: cardiolipin synthase [Xenorhabdus]|uniref:Cardiolipin synthase A n=1 Tax=Xenorhabdus ehlersii TaxID=290111 RepID=A0A2D0IQY1_9GAMM|nr:MULTISPECIES: cardiolipin synthase [Xenorhabdus]MBC8950799.1 cardiolipin synthetase [Xenorhabdus sp. TS4]PHM24194.1 cardiolipin synthetase [Xenorhabdus ehlersii]RKE91112.1 cardiolipin synthetase 2 [Xenorhabdus ehlersii]